MKTTYENFEELAHAMTRGEGILHASNCSEHRGVKDGCIPWQQGVLAFAEWLDHIGVKVQITDGAEDFYEFVAKQR
jgi:hypothetical protein